MNAQAIPVPAGNEGKRDHLMDGVFRFLVLGAALFVLLSLVGAAASMLWGGRLAFETFGWAFMATEEWDVAPAILARWSRSTARWLRQPSR